jgi:hypothetical protein
MNYELVLLVFESSGVQEFRSSGVQPISWGVFIENLKNSKTYELKNLNREFSRYHGVFSLRT